MDGKEDEKGSVRDGKRREENRGWARSYRNERVASQGLGLESKGFENDHCSAIMTLTSNNRRRIMLHVDGGVLFVFCVL